MNLLFWLLLNLGVPIMGPVFTLALTAPTHGSVVARTLVFESLKDGQMFWSAIAVSAAAIYEAVMGLQESRGMPAVLATGIVVFCAIAFTCSILVMIATVKAYTERLPPTTLVAAQAAGLVAFAPTEAVIKSSLYLTGLVAAMSGGLHIYLSI
jgi:hypothetical protein